MRRFVELPENIVVVSVGGRLLVEAGALEQVAREVLGPEPQQVWERASGFRPAHELRDLVPSSYTGPTPPLWRATCSCGRTFHAATPTHALSAHELHAEEASRHRLRDTLELNEGGWQARCDCGYETPAAPTTLDAHLLLTDHIATVGVAA